MNFIPLLFLSVIPAACSDLIRTALGLLHKAACIAKHHDWV